MAYKVKEQMIQYLTLQLIYSKAAGHGKKKEFRKENTKTGKLT